MPLLALVALFGIEQRSAIQFSAVTHWMATAKLVCGQVLSLCERESSSGAAWGSTRGHSNYAAG